MIAEERIEGTLSTWVNGHELHCTVLLDVFVAPQKDRRGYTVWEILRVELVPSSDVPDGGPYILSYIYNRRRYEVTGVYVRSGIFINLTT